MPDVLGLWYRLKQPRVRSTVGLVSILVVGVVCLVLYVVSVQSAPPPDYKYLLIISDDEGVDSVAITGIGVPPSQYAVDHGVRYTDIRLKPRHFYGMIDSIRGVRPNATIELLEAKLNQIKGES